MLERRFAEDIVDAGRLYERGFACCYNAYSVDCAQKRARHKERFDRHQLLRKNTVAVACILEVYSYASQSVGAVAA